MNNQYDVVIIGSGLGGLECGVMLSKEGYRVCVLEQGALFGGCLQSFSRNGRSIDTGIHYIGSMGEGQIMRQYLKYFGILDRLSLTQLDEDFDVISLGEKGTFCYKRGYPDFYASLSARFPAEREGLKRYCARMAEIGASISVEKHREGIFSAGGLDLLSRPAWGFVCECVTDPVLRGVLAGTNVLYGGDKEASTLYHHAMINHSNIEGAYRVVGGTQRIADLLVEQIRANGGTVRNGSKVVKIKTEGSRVSGVVLENDEPVFGTYFISDAHPAKTFALLDDTPFIKKAAKSRMELLPNTYGLFAVYLLMKPGAFPYLNKNFYYYRNEDVWDTVLNAPDLMPKTVMLHTQQRTPDAKCSEVVTLLTPVRSRVFEPWSGTVPGNRGEEYRELKERISNRIIRHVAQHCPQLTPGIEQVYSASTLTYEHYTGTPNGSAYGLLKDYKSMLTTLIPTRTKLHNLFLTGQNLNVHGAIGVTLTAATTCAELLGTTYLAKKIGGV